MLPDVREGQHVTRTGRLSVLNTSDDLARILMKEIAGEEYAGKAALYHLAQMFLENHDSIPSFDDVREDVVEYLLMVGSAAQRTSASDIEEYVEIKGELKEKKGTLDTPNPRFKELLSDVLLRKPRANKRSKRKRLDLFEQERYAREHKSKLDEIVAELSTMYKGILMGVQSVSAAEYEPMEERTFIPPDVTKAAHALLVNFPILQRIELANYKDIIAGIEVDSLLGELKPYYKSQLRDYVDSRIDSIVRQIREREEGELEGEVNAGPYLRKCTASEVLLQAKVGYLFTRGVEVMTSRVSRKHFSSDDCRFAVLAGLSGIATKPLDRAKKAKERMRDMNYSAYVHGNYRSKSAYIANAREEMERYNDRGETFGSDAEFRMHMRDVVKTPSNRFNLQQRMMLTKVLGFVAGGSKVNISAWDSFFSAYKGKVEELDEIGVVMLAYAAGMKVHRTIKYEDESDNKGDRDDEDGWDDEDEKPRGERKVVDTIFNGIGITGFISRGGLDDKLKPRARVSDYDEDDDRYEPYLEEGEVYIPMSNFGRAIEGMVATYVNNKVLPTIKDTGAYDLSHFTQWRSSMEFGFTFSPQAMAIADELISRYPIFSRIPVLDSRDIPNGIALHVLQRATNDYRLDDAATISQNLIVRQLYAMNRLVGVDQ